jgi:hypothetical protein
MSVHAAHVIANNSQLQESRNGRVGQMAARLARFFGDKRFVPQEPSEEAQELRNARRNLPFIGRRSGDQCRRNSGSKIEEVVRLSRTRPRPSLALDSRNDGAPAGDRGRE